MDKNLIINTTQFLIYKSDNNDVKVDVLIQDENIWLTIEQMAELFGKGRSTINEHILNIYKDGELEKDVSMRKIGKTDFSTKPTNYYNLDTIISVGYRVKSIQGVRFRQWATARLQEYIIKGFTMDDERLKNTEQVFGKDYFREQLERIRDVRSSERRFYQQITDIYAECSIDYDKNSLATKEFFATVQNKLHWAITKQTAAEIIYSRANHINENMGLTTWKNAPTGRVRKTDVTVAKNYLQENELNTLNRIVTMYLDYAEDQAERNIPMTMKDWSQKLNAFLQFNERDILQDAGKVTAVIAKEFAISEFEKYKVIQDKSYKSDFDMLLQELDKDGKII
ncbi:virulence RhuM family protein [Sulfurimonas sp. SAG-AH-194-L11]|nr:virulence RhuM family protein [Sulfurimonas sp. SAG-AH-194-L11]MDF1876461.1 virulence RhuM family protein [Sulfurimonas sp. SAG-AH-194-L11]